MIDWLLVMIIVSVISTVGTWSFAFFKIRTKRPDLLRLAEISTESKSEGTTYNWNLILSIFMTSIAFGTGVFILSNVVLFIIQNIWYVDSRSVGVLVIVFGVFMFKEFDKFITGTIRQQS